ncbi:MAG TPA: hypothetical protein VK660_07200 [Xanthomonadaceae bacterium]|jgi:hypothetical protein|nr:hypothetical protein [Xanthomonadaceae bacterium]
MKFDDRIRFDGGKKFDIQLKAGLIEERKLAWLLGYGNVVKIEVKSESWLWERTGRIAIELASRGQPSGLSVTEADLWVHNVMRDGETLAYIMFPIKRLRDLVTLARLRGNIREHSGDGGQQTLAVIRLSDILE